MSERRPLVLTVYDLGAFPHLVAKARGAARAKRLTDAELAAEYWKAYAEWDLRPSLHGMEHDGAWAVMYRFATHPHYDERRTDA